MSGSTSRICCRKSVQRNRCLLGPASSLNSREAPNTYEDKLLNKVSSEELPAAEPKVRRGIQDNASCEAVADVLVVEDNPLAPLVILQQLRELGCAARVATSGVAALEIVQDMHFDLVLLDCRLPGIDGYETARAIRAFETCHDRKPTAIVAVTGDGDIECVDKCLLAGMDGHLSKPTDVAGLRAMIGRFIT